MPCPTQFVDIDGKQLQETFPVRSRRLRPAPPLGVQLVALDDYEIGQAVSCSDSRLDGLIGSGWDFMC